MSHKEYKELETQVDDLLDRGLVREGKSFYTVLTMLVHEKYGFLENVCCLPIYQQPFDLRGSKVQHNANSRAI